MALITKIRKNFWFVLILLGLALAAFIMMDVQGSQAVSSSANNPTLGTVNGQRIGYQDYQLAEGNYFRGSTGDIYAKRESIWDYFVERSILQNESKELGLSVSKDELMDLQFGANPSPIIQQNWANPQTRQLDVAQLQQIKGSIESNEMNPEFKAYWREQENQIVKSQLENKINNLVSKAIYTPNWMAESSFKDDNTKVDFNYVKIPFDAITETVNLKDEDYQNYINNNAYKYTEKEETRNVEYAVFNVIPTSEDSTALRESMREIKQGFRNAENDSLYAVTNNGSVPPVYFKTDQLPEGIRDRISSMTPGELYGPYVDAGTFSVVKLIDSKNIPDSVSARHILRNADANNAIQVAAADAYVDSLLNRLNRGVESFDSLAIKNSQDPSNAFKGGDLGTFVQGRMVGPFNDVCFLTGKKGGVYKVKTTYGIHIVKVEDQIYSDSDNEYKVGLIAKPIVPSEETQNRIYDQVSDVVAANRTIESLRTAIGAMDGVAMETSQPLKINDYAIGTLGSDQSSRDIVKFAFDEVGEVGDVSADVYSYTDKVNYYDAKYVIAALGSVNPKGLQSVDALRSSIEPIVMNQKKAKKMIKNLNYSSLQELADQRGGTVESATDVSLSVPFIQGLGNEKDVVNKAFATSPQSVSKPIIGNGGVYVVETLSKQDAGEVNNIPSLKQTLSTSAKSQVAIRLLDALKKKAKVEDNRSTFF